VEQERKHSVTPGDSQTSLSLGQLAALLGGDLEGPPDRMVTGVKGLEQAGPQDVAFLANPKYARFLEDCRAGVVLVKPDQAVPHGLAVIRVADPYLAYAKLLTEVSRRPYEPGGVHPQAAVDPSASLGEDVTIHALAYVGPGAVIGDRTVLHSGVHVGQDARVGSDTVLHPNVTLYHGCKIGDRCIIHAGTVIGADGFGFAPDGDRYFKIPQIGIVEIDDEVELGALNAVDRAATGRTYIGPRVKTDNLVQIAHNVEIGADSLLVSQVGISGSSKLGRGVVLGGQVGLVGHITLGDRVQVGAQAGVLKSVPADSVVLGSPAIPHRNFLRQLGLIKKLPQLFKRVKDLEKQAADGKEND
jgi:UDP-3-O-[3-hydroxymyristoyl] glucosamine N-acyltransferase